MYIKYSAKVAPVHGASVARFLVWQLLHGTGMAVLQMLCQQTSQMANPVRYMQRMAPTWQLQQDEVVVLAGCIPPIEASR
jgi:hypothetical protein